MRTLILSLCALVASCAGSLALPESDQKGFACCESVSEMVFQPASPGKVLTLEYSSGAPTLTIQGVRTYARGVSLTSTAPSRIEVETVLSTQYLPMATAFMPAALFLNERGVAIGSGQAIELREDARFWDGGFFAGSVRVPQGATSVVLMSRRTLLRESTDEGVSMRADNGRRHFVKPSEVGTLRVKLVEQ